MKNKLLLTCLCAILFGVIISPKGMKAQPAEGFNPADDMYIKADTDHYWKGRYSNGRIFAEYIAKELAGDYDNLTNYAVGGAFSGNMSNTEEEHTNWSAWLKGWGGVQQTETFLHEVAGEADPEALYIISIGGNDTYAVEDLGVEQAAERASDYSLEMVQNLVEGGAKYILLPNRYKDERTDLTDFSDIRNQQVVEKVEGYLALDSTPDDVEVIYGHNQQLRENIDEQGFEKFGYKSMGFYLVSDWVPAYGYGLASEDNSDIFPTNDAEDIYGSYSHYSTNSEYYNPEAAGWKPDDFYTYDEYHLSNRSQKHLATYLLNSDISTGEGLFEQVYNGDISTFAEAISDGTIPSEYSTVYTFGDSSIDTGRGLEVTTELVENRGTPKEDSYVVTAGDNLWHIAKNNYHGEQTNAQILKEVQAIYQANQNQIENPDLIYPDQRITLPPMDESKSMK